MDISGNETGGDTLTFRFAQAKDAALILQFIRDLATYEQMADQVTATEELLIEWLFEKQKAEVLFAVVNGSEVGFALFFHNFSTFLGKAGIYLEDLFVKPELPGHGIRERDVSEAFTDRRGARLRKAGMVVPGFEQAQRRLLSVAGRRPHGRLDRVPYYRQHADGAGKPRVIRRNFSGTIWRSAPKIWYIRCKQRNGRCISEAAAFGHAAAVRHRRKRFSSRFAAVFPPAIARSYFIFRKGGRP